ncbi:hypothetical protein [Kaustia mangrovi]|nr:hypothetical protein [Kaustia mangrovi]
MARPFDHHDWTGHTEPEDALVPIAAIVLGGVCFLIIGVIVL